MSLRLAWATQREIDQSQIKVENKNNQAGYAVVPPHTPPPATGRGTFYCQGYPDIQRTGRRTGASSVSNQKPESHPLSLLPCSKKSWDGNNPLPPQAQHQRKRNICSLAGPTSEALTSCGWSKESWKGCKFSTIRM